MTDLTRPMIVSQTITKDQLEKLTKSLRTLTASKDEIVAQIREKIGHAQEKQNLHTGAHAIYKKFDKMEAPQLVELWDHLLHMMEVGGVFKKMDDVITMFRENRAKDGEAEGDETRARSGTANGKKPRARAAAGAAFEAGQQHINAQKGARSTPETAGTH